MITLSKDTPLTRSIVSAQKEVKALSALCKLFINQVKPNEEQKLPQYNLAALREQINVAMDRLRYSLDELQKESSERNKITATSARVFLPKEQKSDPALLIQDPAVSKKSFYRMSLETSKEE